MRQWRTHISNFAVVYVDGMDIVIDDAITGEQIKRKTVDEKFSQYIDSLFKTVIELTVSPDLITGFFYIGSTKFVAKNGISPSFYFPKYVKELIECCYIVANEWGATLHEIGWCDSGYKVAFVGLGEWI